MTSDPALHYYDGPDVTGVVFDALRGAGRSVDELDSDDLAALDEFHALGRPATLALAELAAVRPGDRVLDVGAGIGGPSRVLARHYGAQVTALDPTVRFCALNREISERSGLAGQVTVVGGDARDLPFEDGSFDVVWTQAVLQNVADKARVAAEVRRVLRPGGRYALFEVLAGPGGELEFPVPWADGPDQSFLVTADELRRTLEAAGLEVSTWRTQAEVQASIMDAASSHPHMAPGVPEVSLALLMPDFDARMGSLARNVGGEKIGIVQAVLVSP
jgi:SAM-dependent methyltransferase